MSNALSVSPSFDTKWTIVSGPMAGAVRLMHAGSFTIGRSPENEFVIVDDPKCSRKHAAIQWTDQGCEILSLNDNNLVQVNGATVSRGVLNDNDVVILGDTEMRFNLTTSHEGTNELAVHDPAMAPMQTHRRTRSRSSRRAEKSGSSRMVIYAVVGIFLLFLFTGNTKKKKDELTLRTEKQIQADIDAANKLQEAAQNAPSKKIGESVTSSQAQENFVRGFRDYREGQFERALDSFQACLALNPSHTLCNRYIRLAQRRFNELVQYDIVLGRKYRDQNQFRSCRAAFRNVMVMVKDSNSPIYKEAKANYDACNALVEGRF